MVKTMYLCDWTWRQGVVPAATIEREGFGAVWLKAGGATTGDPENGKRERFVDPTFFEGARALSTTAVLTGAYWYLTPGRLATQAGLFYDILLEATRSKRHALRYIAPKLDVEEAGLTHEDTAEFVGCWDNVSARYPLVIYTNRTLWNKTLPVEVRDAPGDRSGIALSPYLEEAHWVSESVRTDPKTPYASLQAKAINPEWWRLPYGDGTAKRFGYGGWASAKVLQFTNNALIAGKRQMASVFQGSQADFATTFMRV